MNILDENISRTQRQLLQDWHVPIRHIGYEIGRKGMQDDESALFIRRLLRHQAFDTQVKRMGAVIRAAYSRLDVWRVRVPRQAHLRWE